VHCRELKKKPRNRDGHTCQQQRWSQHQRQITQVASACLADSEETAHILSSILDFHCLKSASRYMRRHPGFEVNRDGGPVKEERQMQLHLQPSGPG
jgi:hypothetical protein